MSSILKALKRLENENAARKPDFLKIDAEILKSASPRRSSSLAVIIAGCAVFASGGLAAYVFLKREMPVVSDVKSTVSAPAAPGAAAAPAEPEPGHTENIPATPTGSFRPASDSPGVFPRPLMPRQQSRTEMASDVATKAVHTPELKPVAPLPSAPIAAAPTKPAVLKVDGIAFQDGGSDSLAVVNGATVTKGSVIEGVRVEEIQKDRVKFSRGAEKFEIILDRSN